MIDQFFGRPFRVSLLILVGTFLLSVCAYYFHLSNLILLLLFIVMTIVTYKNPVHGLSGIFLELFSNPHGHLISSEGLPFSLSLRMILFLGFFLGYTLFCFRQKKWPHPNQTSLLMLVPLAIAVVIGFVNGSVLQNLSIAFQDGNAYLFLLYAIPILSHDWKASEQRTLLQILAAGAVWNILLTFGLLYLYAHFSETSLQGWYVFLRDVRLAEITRVSGVLYRVFIQTQFFTMVLGAFILTLLFTFTSRRDQWISALCLGGVIATLLFSFSRSFWIGITFACLLLVGLLFSYSRLRKQWVTLSIWSLCSFFFSIVFILLIFLLPPGSRLFNFADALSERSTTTDVATSSRWNLLHPMISEIAQHPFIGSGFGKAVTFTTDDPRARAIHPDGTWTTYTMEWGWLELWLKMGILGPVSFLLLFAFFTKQFLRDKKTDRFWIGIGCLTSLLFLYMTHFFSPYLNHPIGLGFILFLFIFLPSNPKPVVSPVQVLQSHLLVSRQEVGNG